MSARDRIDPGGGAEAGPAGESAADTIRRAAALMRERARKATPGPWDHMCLGSEGCLVLRATGSIRERGRGRVARFGQKDWQADHADAAFVAGMNPAVALAVADWLDNEAAATELVTDPQDTAGTLGLPDKHALAVARAYLGEEKR